MRRKKKKEILKLPQRTWDPTEKVNMNLNHLFCSVTQISTESNEEILDKEGNEVERFLQEQITYFFWPPVLHLFVAMAIWKYFLVIINVLKASLFLATLTLLSLNACMSMFSVINNIISWLAAWLALVKQDVDQGLSHCVKLFRFLIDKQK